MVQGPDPIAEDKISGLSPGGSLHLDERRDCYSATGPGSNPEALTPTKDMFSNTTLDLQQTMCRTKSCSRRPAFLKKNFLSG